MDTTRPTISAPHEQPKPDIVYMSESGRTGRVANGVANAMDQRDARCTARSARRPPTAFLHGTARDKTPYSMLVAIIIRVGPDGLNNRNQIAILVLFTSGPPMVVRAELVPEPAGLASLMFAAMILAARRNRMMV